jgi:transcription elongation factor Elf1
MNDLKTACPNCGKQEKATLFHDGLETLDKKNGTIPAHCTTCDWKGRVLYLVELGLIKEQVIACTKDSPWDKKTIPVHHVDGDFTDDDFGRFLSCPNCGHNWDIGPDV